MFFGSICAFILTAITGVLAESHSVRFVNNCRSGTPKLIQNGAVLSTGGTYTRNGPIISAIAYLDNGKCLLNGEHCTTVELTLVNPGAPGSGSSADITLIPTHAFSNAAKFAYYGGCDGFGASCPTASCPDAFRKDNDNFAQRACQANNVNLVITFC